MGGVALRYSSLVWVGLSTLWSYSMFLMNCSWEYWLGELLPWKCWSGLWFRTNVLLLRSPDLDSILIRPLLGLCGSGSWRARSRLCALDSYRYFIWSSWFLFLWFALCNSSLSLMTCSLWACNSCSLLIFSNSRSYYWDSLSSCSKLFSSIWIWRLIAAPKSSFGMSFSRLGNLGLFIWGGVWKSTAAGWWAGGYFCSSWGGSGSGSVCWCLTGGGN